MKAARITGISAINIVDMPVPEPGRGEVLCRVARCGICSTDHSIYTGELSFVKTGDITFPMTPGHEWSGTVHKLGDGVDGFKPGDRVVGDSCVSCGACHECLTGRYHLCKSVRCVGTIRTWDGAYAEYVLMPARHLFHLPDSVSLDNGAMAEPAATALHSVVNAEVKAGDKVLVQGAGTIGIMAAKLAKLSGASTVMITDRKDANLLIARQIGIDAAVNTLSESTADAAANLGIEGFDCVIEASGAKELLVEALQLVRSGGVVSAVAFYEKKIDGFDFDRIVFGDITLRGVSGNCGMFDPVLNMMASGMLDFTPLITGRYTIDEVSKAMLDMTRQDIDRIKLMIDFDTN